MTQLRVAIVHERFTDLGGSERVVEQMHAIWPDATVYAPIVDAAAVPPGMSPSEVRSGPLQHLYRGGRGYAHLLPLLPLAMSRIDLDDADLVVTSHHAFANRVRTRPGVPVLSYTYTPARWIWDTTFLDAEVGGRLGAHVLRAFARTQRGPDAAAARRATRILAISRHSADRVRRWWGREADVVHPPVDLDRHTPDPNVGREDFFLLAGRLVPYKRPHIAVAAAVRAGVRLVVAGDGRMRASVEAAAGPGIEILGHVDDATLLHLYRRCSALVFPGEEDFGLVPVEAQACGTPVLARGVGGVLDSVIHGRTGALYDISAPNREIDDLATAFRWFDPGSFDPTVIRRHAEQFSVQAFRTALTLAATEVVERCWAET